MDDLSNTQAPTEAEAGEVEGYEAPSPGGWDDYPGPSIGQRGPDGR